MCLRPTISLVTTLSSLPMAAASVQAAVVNQWVRFAPNDTVLLRAIESDFSNGRPAALVDGQPVALSPRGAVATQAQAPLTYFSVLMCERAPVPAFGHSSAGVAGFALKMPPRCASRCGTRPPIFSDTATGCCGRRQPLRFVEFLYTSAVIKGATCWVAEMA